MKDFKEIMPEQITNNPFELINKDWMLITAKSGDKINTMTASWGGLGILWNKKVATIFVRPTRYTYKLLEQTNTFTLTFFDEIHRDKLNYCGSHSGREVDKIAKTGLAPIEINDGVIFKEAKMAMVCSKLYYQDIDPANFVDDSLDKNYAKKDYHRMYIAEIDKVFVKYH